MKKKQSFTGLPARLRFLFVSIRGDSWAKVLLCLVACALVSGCASATGSGVNTSLSAADLKAMTDQMAMSIAGDAEVRRVIETDGAMPVVILPVQNYMTGEVLPAGQRHAFVARVRSLLAKQSPAGFTWIANLDAYHAARQMELEGVEPGPDPSAMQPRYALQARFDSLTNVDARLRSSSYLAVYELIDLQTRGVLWADSYEVQKTAVKGFLD